MEEYHIPVLLNETIQALDIKEDGIYVDGTVGFGGHSSVIASKLSSKGHLYCIDQDPDALAHSKERLAEYKNVTFVQGNFRNIKTLLEDINVDRVDGILMDIGVSSYQLDTPERGFSFHNDAPLDMRMSKEGTSAADLVNTLSEEELADIIFKYGEDTFSRRIASAIVKRREESPITTTSELAEIVKNAYPVSKRRDAHPARQTFQALRIAVNGELDALSEGLDSAFEMLNVGGVLAIITFHSLEDRIVKQRFADYMKGCTCPPDFPICVCGKTPRAEKAVRKPVTASNEELKVNPRSRSAKLRAVRRIKE